jgi:hypothetical protein
LPLREMTASGGMRQRVVASIRDSGSPNVDHAADDRFPCLAVADWVIASATEDASAGADADECLATMWIVRANSAGRSANPGFASRQRLRARIPTRHPVRAILRDALCRDRPDVAS